MKRVVVVALLLLLLAQALVAEPSKIERVGVSESRILTVYKFVYDGHVYLIFVNGARTVVLEVK